MEKLPAQMTVVGISKPGGPEVLVPETRPVPVPGPGEILVKVKAAGVNRPDVAKRSGSYPPPPGASDLPGLEIAGEVVALGEGATRHKLGDKVMSLVAGGGYAQYCIAQDGQAMAVPSVLSMNEVGAIPETLMTVWHNVFERGGLKPGETLLIHGGSSGIGTMAIQLAKAFGSKVIVTVGSKDKADACLKLGAISAINYKTEDFVAEVKTATDGAGANVILDMVGGDYIERNYDAAAVDGRVVQIAFLGGPKANVNFAKLMVKRLHHTGSTLRPRTNPDKAAMVAAIEAASAIDAVSVRSDAPAIDLTAVLDHQRSDSDRIQVSTAPGTDGIVRRIEVRAREGGQNWVVFALANNTDDQLDRLIVAPHYRIVSSGLLWPDLGLSRIATITPSTGDRPERQESATPDIFRITPDPGPGITFVPELRTDKLPQLYLWEPDAYKDKVNSFTLYQGIVIGISGLLALVLTILFVVKGSIMFPAAAALAWAVLVYIGVDFGFWGKVLDMSNNAERIWRAAGEAILAATLLVFLFAYLNLSRWHVRYSHITAGWLFFLGSLVALALFDPAVASGIARLSLLLIAFAGFALIVYLSTHGFDRAVLLIPTWFLLVVWVIAAGMTVAGGVTNDIVGPALLGGLVLIVMLIGFTVMQHAFAGGGATTGVVSDVERRALALTGSGDLIWDWDVSADKVFTSPETESLLGLKRGTLEGPAAKWLEVLHPLDQDRVRAALDSVLDQRRGRLVQDFRLRTPDGHFMWFALKARPAVRSDGEVSRGGGTLTDVTEAKNAEERMPHDSVHDNLTGLPNRKLFIDRLNAVANLTRAMPNLRPTLMVIDLDRFKQVNDSVGIAVGDSILLTLARRLTRILKPQDTLARLAGDQFRLILMSEQEPARITGFAETIRKTIRAPIAFNDREIFLTASIGLALSDPQTQLSEEIIQDAEPAM